MSETEIYNKLKEIFTNAIKPDGANKGQMPTHGKLSENISKKMMEDIEKEYGEKRIIVRCTVTDSSDQVIAYSLSKDEKIGNAFVLRAIDNLFSYICFVCII